MKKDFDTKDCFTVEGKLALPYSYFAGRVGSSFITTIRDKNKIMGVRCNTCNKVFVPPRQTCERCLEDIRDNWVDLKDTGEISNFTVVRYDDKHLPRKAPFVMAMIKLDGADTPMAHILEGIDVDSVKVGLRVKAVFAEETTNTILDIDHFEPYEEKKVSVREREPAEVKKTKMTKEKLERREAMSNKVIITAALSGAATFKNQNPAVPYTPKEFAEEAAKAYKAGAAMVHVHSKSDDGMPTPDIDRIRATHDAIKDKTPELIVNLSTAIGLGVTAEQRISRSGSSSLRWPR